MTTDARKLVLFAKKTRPLLIWKTILGRTHSFSLPCTHMRTILLIILILLLIGAFPAWPYSTGWGYYPAGGIGLVLLILIILAVAGRI
jgi:hypothetical protein